MHHNIKVIVWEETRAIVKLRMKRKNPEMISKYSIFKMYRALTIALLGKMLSSLDGLKHCHYCNLSHHAFGKSYTNTDKHMQPSFPASMPFQILF